MNPDGYIRIDTKIDQTGAQTGLAQLTSSLKGFGGMIAATFASVAVAGVTKFAGACVDLASDLQEVQNVVDVTFGESSAKIESFAKKADKSFGLSELKAKQFSSTMGAMTKSMGFAEAEAADMATTLAGLAGDMASFYNLDAEDAFAKLRSGISGETEPLKQLGINLSVANLEAYALTQGITKTYEAMTQAEQATLRYNYILSATKDAQGDFARTSDSLANQQRILALEMEKLQTSIGNFFLPIVTGAVQAVNGLFSLFNGGGNTTNAAIESAAKAYEKTKEEIATTAVEAQYYAGRLRELEEAGLNTAEAHNKYRVIVNELNRLMPDLNLKISEQTGLIESGTEALNERIEALKREAYAEAAKAEYLELIPLQKTANDELIKANKDLEASEARLTLAQEKNNYLRDEISAKLGKNREELEKYARSAADLENVAGQMGIDISDLTDELSKNSAELASATVAEYEHQNAYDSALATYEAVTDQINGIVESYEALTGKTIPATEATEAQTEAAKTQTQANKKQIASLQDLATVAKTVTDKTNTLTQALDEQAAAGTLSVDTVNALIAAGYQAAIQINSETGAVTLNKEAYVALTDAQYGQMIAKTELAKKDLVAKMDAERAAVEKYAQSNYYAAMSTYALLAAQEKDLLAYDAQIATLKAAKDAVGKYTGSVSSGAGGTAKAVDKAAKAFEDGVKKINRALALGEITQEEYWRQYAELMTQYLKEGTEAWEDANFELQMGQKELQDSQEEMFDNMKATAVDSLQEIKDEYAQAFDEIQGNIKSLADQLAGIDLVTETTETMFGQKITTMDFADIGDLKEGNAELEQYAANVAKLQELGVSSSLLAQISKMDTDQANAYMQYLIGLGTEGFEAYMAEWEKRQQLAMDAAKLFYQEELDLLQTEFADKLTGALDTLQQQGQSLGESVAAGIVAGILSGQMTIQSAVDQVLGSAMGGGGSTTLTVPTGGLPHLAEGAVIPPNRKFLAVLGDQRSGTNIETPLDTMMAAFRGAMAESGGISGDVVIENVLTLDGTEVYRNQKRVSRQRGRALVKE
jgi:DNA repair exonuclease SbcCD ATPase subunit